MKALRLVYLSGVLGFRALFSWNTPALFFTVLIVTPLLQISFFVLLGGALGYQDPLFFILGSSLQGATAASVSGLVGVIAEERGFGTLAHILVSPASRVAVFVGRLLPGVAIAIGVTAFTSLVGFLIVGVELSVAQMGAYFVSIVAASFAGSALGLTLSSFGLIYRDIFQISSAAQIVLLIATGATVAVVDLPLWVQFVGQGLPLTHAIEAARGVIAQSLTPSEFWSLIGFEMAVGGAWLAVGLLFAKALERLSRTRGTVELY